MAQLLKTAKMTLFLGLLIVLAGLSAVPLHAQGKKLNVITSTTILMDFTKNIAGDAVSLSSIVPTGGDVHEYEPAPQDVQGIADADLIIINGLRLEGFVDKLIQDSGTKAKVVTASDGLGIRAFGETGGNAPTTSTDGILPGIIGFSGSYQCSEPKLGQEIGDCDPHMWQDPTYVIVYVLNIRDALVAADPANTAIYKANAALYIAKLQQLDAEIWRGLAVIPAKNHVLVTNHDALGYFAARYGFKIAGVVLPGGSTDREPAPQEVAALIDQIKALAIPAIFTENVSNTKLAEEIAKQAGVKVIVALYTDALGAAGTPGETYLAMMRANLKVLVDALK